MRINQGMLKLGIIKLLLRAQLDLEVIPSRDNKNNQLSKFAANANSQKEYSFRNQDKTVVRNNYLNSSGEIKKTVS
jgi:hypothetical protein